jgi:hypothetical protein
MSLPTWVTVPEIWLRLPAGWVWARAAIVSMA